MRTYVVERYVPQPTASELRKEGERVTSAARKPGGPRETAVKYLRSIYVPDDEVSFCLFSGPSAEAIVEGLNRANVSFERVLEAEVFEP